MKGLFLLTGVLLIAFTIMAGCTTSPSPKEVKTVPTVEPTMNIIEDFNKSAKEWADEGYALDSKQDYKNAIIAFNKSLNLDPNNADVWEAMGNDLSFFHRDEEAVRAYDQVLMIKPNSDWILSNKAASLNRLGKSDEAGKLCDQAQKMNPNSECSCNVKNGVFNLNCENGISSSEKTG